jgi:hypothetical protein
MTRPVPSIESAREGPLLGDRLGVGAPGSPMNSGASGSDNASRMEEAPEAARAGPRYEEPNDSRRGEGVIVKIMR